MTSVSTDRTKRAVPSSELSIVDGGPAVSGSSGTLDRALWHTAQHAATATVTCVDAQGTRRSLSSRELLADALRQVAHMQSVGVVPGERVLVVFRDPVECVTGFWACVVGGFVPAPIGVPVVPSGDRASAARVTAAFMALGGPWVILPDGTDLAAPSLIALQGRVLADVAGPPVAHARPAESVAPSDVALLLLTSGSTGRPKAVPLTHEALLAEAFALAMVMPLRPSDVTLNWMPLDHVGGVVMMHLAPLVQGASQFQIATAHILERPERWLDLLSQTRATVTWGANFAFAMLAERLGASASSMNWDLSSLHTIVNGGEAVNLRTARAFVSLLGDAKLDPGAMRPAWGMSETASATIIADGLRGCGESGLVPVGRPVPGMKLRIVDDGGDVVPAGTTGALEVSGPMVITGYLDPEQGRDQFVGDGWFATGDQGFLCERELVLVGRGVETIIVNGVNHHAAAIEMQIATLPFVRPGCVAVVGHRPPAADTDAVLVFVALAPDADEAGCKGVITAMVGRDFGLTVEAVVPLAADDFPRTSLGKIQRRALVECYAEAGERTEDVPVLTHDWVRTPAADHRMESPPNAMPMVVVDVDQLDGSHDSAALEAAAAAPLVVLVADARTTMVAPANRVEAWTSGAQRFLQAASRGRDRQRCRIRLLVLQREGDPGVDPAGAALASFLCSASRELSWLSTRNLYVSEDVATALRVALDDLMSDGSADVLYRDGHRYVRCYRAVAATEIAAGRDATPTGAAVILGLGAIGSLLTDHLQATTDRVVYSFGRGVADSPRSVRHHHIRGDVLDRGAVRAFLQRVIVETGGIDRVFFLAGHFDEWPVLRLDDTRISEGLRAKALGASILLEELVEVGAYDASVTFFSSLVATFGAALHSVYAAGNAYLEALCANWEQHRRLRRPTCLSWGIWEDTGISRGVRQRSHSFAAGYGTVPVASALRALDEALAWNEGPLYLGLHRHGDLVRDQVGAVASGPDAWSIAIRKPTGARPARPVPPEPGTQEQTHDPVFRQLSILWSETLGVTELDVQANFFALGGTSMSLVNVYDRICEEFDVELSLVDLFESESLGAMANLVRIALP